MPRGGAAVRGGAPSLRTQAANRQYTRYLAGCQEFCGVVVCARAAGRGRSARCPVPRTAWAGAGSLRPVSFARVRRMHGSEEDMNAFARRRDRFLELCGSGVAVLRAAPELTRPGGGEVPYRQHGNLFYLTGWPEPEAVAVLTPYDEEHRFTLFVRPRDADREVWTGPRIGVEGARERFGATAVYPITELAERLPELLRPASRVWYALGVDPATDRLLVDLMVQFRRTRPRTGYGPTAVEDPAPLLGRLRLVKEPAEIARLRRAAGIAVAAHRAAIAHVRPGAGEWELQALLEHGFRDAGAAGPAFPSIVAAGPGATVLHYTANNRRIAAGELLLLDAGAEWQGYCSDISRTVPVSGRFTEPQRALYEVVLSAQRAALRTVRPGATTTDLHDAAVREITTGLVRLGILRGAADDLIREEAYKPFFMHQTSHWLGLDVHDAGPYREPAALHPASVPPRPDASPPHPVRLEPGMVLTVEPGVYIAATAEAAPEPFRGVGIRIEDDVLVTADGHEVLTTGLPVDPQEVERLVGLRWRSGAADQGTTSDVNRREAGTAERPTTGLAPE